MSPSASTFIRDDMSPDMKGKISALEKKYQFPKIVYEKFPELPELVLETESMKEEERHYWFQMLSVMKEDQIVKFRDILLNEKRQLAHLDEEYKKEVEQLNDKNKNEWNAFEAQKKWQVIRHSEKKSEEVEKAAEEDLLKKLNEEK